MAQRLEALQCIVPRLRPVCHFENGDGGAVGLRSQTVRRGAEKRGGVAHLAVPTVHGPLCFP